MKKYILLILTLCMHCIARGQTAHYWFDNQSGEARLMTNVVMGQFDIDVSELKEGAHTLHYQATDSEGTLSPTMSATFIKPYRIAANASGAETFRCWFDEDIQNAVTGRFADGAFFLNTEGLRNGVHTVHLYAEGEYPSPTVSCTYIKFDTPEDRHIQSLRCVCYIDGVEVEEQMFPATGGAVNWNVDVAQLSLGVHTQRIAVYDQNNIALAGRSSVFVHVPQKEKYLTKYDYWLNDDDVMKTVELEGQPTNYNLLTMLPVESRPIRSECFHFAVEDGVPKVYAKNDIHLRFHDVRGDLTDVSGQYVDEHISQPVEATLLQSGISQTIDKPAANEIKWFKLEAVRGDSLSFKLNRAATLQVFSPSGEEIYRACSPEVLQFDGAYAQEDGVYYVAIHDVTANTNTVSIDYEHIDKYAVLSYSPKDIGVITCFVEMQLDGNGFDKLDKVQLVLDKSIIEPDSINIVSKSHAILRFPIFGDEQIGDYDIRLDFNDNGTSEQLTISKGLTLSTVEMGNIKIQVKPSKTVGYPYPVTISITNNGNVSMLYVPFNIATTFDLSEWRANASFGESAWASMWPMNFNLFEHNDSIGYSPYTTSNSLFGTGLPGMVLHGFIPILGPHETRDYIVGFVGSGHAKFKLYAWTGRPMNATYDDNEGETNIYSVWKYLEKLNEADDSPRNSRVHRAPPNYEGMNNVLNVADHINSNAAQAARTAAGIGLVGGGLINGLRLRQIHQYDDDDFASEVLSDYRESLEQNMPDPSTIASIAGIPDLMAALMGLQQRQAGCGTPMPEGHVIEILAPGDPNDISGYTSDSGSRYMKEGTTDVYYSIEFENDPELANASAHTITVIDTLDAERFDLTSFKPTGVNIGRKRMTLNGETSFTNKTLDLRPESEVIAQVSLNYNEQKGIAKWTIESLDPYSMEPIADAYRGALPVNTDGNGMGELTFDIKLKSGLQDGDEVSNRASIVFDQEAAIMTPTWTNIVDGVNPISHVENVIQTTDSTAVVHITASDERSKPWQYDLYRQNGVGASWQREAVGVPADSSVVIAIESGVNYGFYVVMTDSAGNVEQKQAVREFILNLSGSTPGDVNGDGVTDTQDAIKVTQFYLKKNPTDFLEEAADVNGDGTIDTQDAIKIIKIYLKKE